MRICLESTLSREIIMPRGDSCAGAVQVVDPPAAEPGSVPFLLGQQPGEPGGPRLVVAVLLPEHLEGVGGDVGGRLVCPLAEVADRPPVETERPVVDVEGSPTV